MTDLHVRRRGFVQAAAAAVSLCLAPAATRAEAYPRKSVRLIVPFPPGGSNDVLARTVAAHLQRTWNQSFIVENKPGAGGNLATDEVVRSAPDGHTLLVAASTIVTANPYLYPSLSFDPWKDLRPVAMLGSTPMILVVRPESGIKTVQELIASSKRSPDGFAYASAGVGTIQHLAAELFKTMTGAKLLHVPYRGTAASIVDLLADRVQTMFAPSTAVEPYIKSGRLRALAVTSLNRSALFPDLPTVAETGLSGFKAEVWALLMAPGKTPDAIVGALKQNVDEGLASRGVVAQLRGQSVVTQPVTQAELVALLRQESATWEKLVRDVGIRAE